MTPTPTAPSSSDPSFVKEAGWSLADLSPAVADMLLWSPSAVDAVAGAVWLLTGRRMYVQHNTDTAYGAFYVVPWEDNQWVAAFVANPPTWFSLCEEAPPGTRVGEQTGHLMVANRRTVETLLSSFNVRSDLTSRVASTGANWRVMGLYLAAWWDARLHEGHTPTSAGTLLALVASAENVRRSAAVRGLRTSTAGAVRCPPDPSAAPEDWTVQAMHVMR